MQCLVEKALLEHNAGHIGLRKVVKFDFYDKKICVLVVKNLSTLDTFWQGESTGTRSGVQYSISSNGLH